MHLPLLMAALTLLRLLLLLQDQPSAHRWWLLLLLKLMVVVGLTIQALVPSRLQNRRHLGYRVLVVLAAAAAAFVDATLLQPLELVTVLNQGLWVASSRG